MERKSAFAIADSMFYLLGPTIPGGNASLCSGIQELSLRAKIYRTGINNLTYEQFVDVFQDCVIILKREGHEFEFFCSST